MLGTRSRGEFCARAEILLCNSGNDKRSAEENFSKRTEDRDNALRRQSPNRDMLVAILLHAARFGVAQLAIARANAPAHVATCDRSHQPPVRHRTRDFAARDSAKLVSRDNPHDRRRFASADSIPLESRARAPPRRVRATVRALVIQVRACCSRVPVGRCPSRSGILLRTAKWLQQLAETRARGVLVPVRLAF